MATQREPGLHHGPDDEYRDADTRAAEEHYHRDATRGGIYDRRTPQQDARELTPLERSRQWGYRNLAGGFSRGGEGADNTPSPKTVRYPNTGEGYVPRHGEGRDADSEDQHYRSWREEQIRMLDEEYEAYRRENQDRFNSEFESWRNRRARSHRTTQQ